MEKEKYLSGVGISFGEGEQIEVVVSYVEILYYEAKQFQISN